MRPDGRIGQTRSAIFSIFFIVIHAVGSLWSRVIDDVLHENNNIRDDNDDICHNTDDISRTFLAHFHDDSLDAVPLWRAT